jgi:two-component system response regulator PilR (NtrC family)
MIETVDSRSGEVDKPTVLIVDDEPDLLELVSLTLSRMNLQARTAADVGTARRLLKSEKFDLCLTDMRLPDGDGLDLVSKPLDLGVLRKLVGSAIRLGSRGGSERTSVTFRGPRLLGHSEIMEQLREMIARVARSQAPVHIYGESGTGKELVARLIHESGARNEGPFVAVNCGAIPTELMESELFGHKRGSFTGAVSDKKGLIQSAEGGTLFLDEVADLPLHMQVKLLRVVQEKTLRPIGESREETIDVRILSATHKNLGELIGQGLFREDLFYRINVIELRVPALRERRADIPEIAEAVLQRLGRRANMDAPELAADAIELLQDYPFPGNVRELENVLERALTLCADGIIAADHIKLRGAPRLSVTEVTPAASQEDLGGGALGDKLEDMERDAIVKALEKTRYNKTAAAKLLGMSFRALRYRVKKLGIE